MAEIINSNVFNSEKKFVDFAGLDYFWEKAKAYVDGVDTVISGRLDTAETNIKSIQDELNSLSGGVGSVATQIENAIALLDVTDAAVDGEYVSSVSEVDGKISVTRAALPDYTEVYDAKGAGAAAEAAAKAYVDGIVNDKEVEGETVKGLNSRVADLEAIDHEKLASDASAAAVATILDGAPEKFDTLKEVAQWIEDSETAASAADLVTRVSALEAIDHEAYKAADETVLSSAKSHAETYTNETIAGLDLANTYDAKGAAAQALVDAKAEVTALKNGDVKANADAIAIINGEGAGSIAKAKADAIADAAAKIAALSEVYDAKGSAAQALADAKTYAATYTDALFNSIGFASTSDIDTIFA